MLRFLSSGLVPVFLATVFSLNAFAEISSEKLQLQKALIQNGNETKLIAQRSQTSDDGDSEDTSESESTGLPVSRGTSGEGGMTQLRRGIATVVLCGLGGAVLGLSTLSFEPEPQQKISNVTGGFGLGLIAGAIYFAFKPSMSGSAASSPASGPLIAIAKENPQLGWTWSF